MFKNITLIFFVVLSVFLGISCLNYQRSLTKIDNKLTLSGLQLKIANEELLKANVEVHRLALLAELGAKNIQLRWSLKEQE